MSEIDFNLTGLDKTDLSSVLCTYPVGASVPPISFQKLQNIFPNLKVRKLRYSLNGRVFIYNEKRILPKKFN